MNNLGQGQCICKNGCRGDGKQCSVSPSDGLFLFSVLNIHFSLLMSIRGHANPDMAILDSWPASGMRYFRDLGPEVTHYYEVSNFGPFSVGNVIVSEFQKLSYW